MKVLKGTPIFPAIVKGEIYLYKNEAETDIPHYKISDPALEIARVSASIADIKTEIQKLIDKHTQDKNIREICTVHLMILNDNSLIIKIYDFINTYLENAEHAISDTFQEYIDKYKLKNNHFQELAYDFIDLRDRIINRLMSQKNESICPKTSNNIVAADKLTPYMVLNSKKDNVAAYIIKEGGFTTHAMILARSMGIPIIFNIDISKNLHCLDKVILDTYNGKVIIKPDKKTLAEYDQKIENIKNKHDECKIHFYEDIKTQTGEKLTLKVNVSIPDEVHLLNELAYDGIGLLRTEFLFLKRDHAPTEEKQFKMYKMFLEAAKDKPVTIRFLDIGSDKLPLFFDLPDQINPDLEIRGARAIEIFPEAYLAQAKALLRAGQYGNLKILYPLVSDISDIFTFKELMKTAKKELKKEGKKFSNNYKEGIMIETPSAALLAEELLEHVDFANIGSNDLQQYTLAASREHKTVEKRYHIFHPAIIKLLEIIVKASKKTKKKVCLCGEISSFEDFYPIFLKLGLTSFSVSISKLFYIKCELMHLKEQKDIDFKKIFQSSSKDELTDIFAKYS